MTRPASLGRGWGRGEDLLSWKAARGRGLRGRGRGRGHAVPYVLNRNADYQKQQQLNEMVTNSSTTIQNPIETFIDFHENICVAVHDSLDVFLLGSC